MEDHIVRRTCMAALGLKPRRQIRQPLRGGVNEHGLHALVETREDECTDKNEKHAKCRLHGMVSDLRMGSRPRPTGLRPRTEPYSALSNLIIQASSTGQVRGMQGLEELRSSNLRFENLALRARHDKAPNVPSAGQAV